MLIFFSCLFLSGMISEEATFQNIIRKCCNSLEQKNIENISIFLCVFLLFMVHEREANGQKTKDINTDGYFTDRHISELTNVCTANLPTRHKAE